MSKRKQNLIVKDPKKPVVKAKKEVQTKKAVDVPAVVSTPKDKAQVKAKVESKMDLATQYLEDNSGLRRRDALKYFRESIGLTPAGAATYWNIIRVKLNYKTPK